MPRFCESVHLESQSVRKLLLLLVTAALVLFLGVRVGQWWLDQQSQGSGPNTSAQPAPDAPDNPAAVGLEQCPVMELIAAPGTWESRADDDPLNPQTWPSYLRSITDPLKERFPDSQLRVWTVPYVAQLRNINAMREVTYDESLAQGTQRVTAELAAIHSACPRTRFILIGFSQGAALQGDIANQIGTDQGAVPPESVAQVILVADPRRENQVGINPGVPVTGVGAEIRLQPVSALIQPVTPGATMRGPRPGGFGMLADRTYQLCAPGDAVCDAPTRLDAIPSNTENYLLGNIVHAQYATNPDVIEGTTASQWAIEQIVLTVQNAL